MGLDGLYATTQQENSFQVFGPALSIANGNVHVLACLGTGDNLLRILTLSAFPPMFITRLTSYQLWDKYRS
jgi:hypothetical protein